VVQAAFNAPPPPPPPPPPQTATLDLLPRGNGSGNVLVNGTLLCQRDQGVNTGACKVTLPLGTVVSIDAVLPSGSRLEGWGGACSGTSGSRCTLTVTRDDRVAIGFEKIP
jgi:hypothetical protein